MIEDSGVMYLLRDEEGEVLGRSNSSDFLISVARRLAEDGRSLEIVSDTDEVVERIGDWGPASGVRE